MPASPPATERHRPQFTLSTDLLEWVSRRAGPGHPFVSEGHAIELALARLHDEQAFIRATCRREEVPFRAALFWQLYQDAIDQSQPPRVGRPRKDEKPVPSVGRRLLNAFVSARLTKWMDDALQGGPFSTTSHIVETGLRHLCSLDDKNRIAGEGFPFDGKQLWTRYRKLLAEAGK